MRIVDCTAPRPAQGQEERLARLTRHLEARLRDFGPGGPEVLETDQQAGFVAARFPGHSTGEVVERLARECGVSAAPEGDRAVFYLHPGIPFEDLDYLWGCLFGLL